MSRTFLTASRRGLAIMAGLMLLLLTMGAAAFMALGTVHLARFDRAPRPLIDAHMHMFGWNVYGDPPEANLITGMPPAARSDAEVIRDYVATMDEHNIVLAIGSGPLETIRHWRAQDPERFIAGIEFPRRTMPVYRREEYYPEPEILRDLYEAGELGLMGEITAQYAGLAPTDPALDPYFALASELGVPVSFHSGFGPQMSAYRGDPDFRMRLGNPLLLEDVLVRHPDLRLYIAHGGYPFLDDTIALMMQYTQVYVDISAIDWLLTRAEFHRYLQRLVDARLGDRILFGTDQMIWPDTIALAIEAVESAPFLAEDQKHAIFFANAVDFFQLDADRLLGGPGLAGPGGTVVRAIRTPLQLRPREPGAHETVSVDLDLEGVTSSALQITGFDIDAVEEVLLTVNGTAIGLPGEVVSDMQERTVTVPLPEGTLKSGENRIDFLFAEAVGGTTGFAIHDLRVLLRRNQPDPP
jgi:predicted TIM-barrel fold metal-dependent hydrolase